MTTLVFPSTGALQTAREQQQSWLFSAQTALKLRLYKKGLAEDTPTTGWEEETAACLLLHVPGLCIP